MFSFIVLSILFFVHHLFLVFLLFFSKSFSQLWKKISIKTSLFNLKGTLKQMHRMNKKWKIKPSFKRAFEQSHVVPEQSIENSKLRFDTSRPHFTLFFRKMGQTRPLFVYFRLFRRQIKHLFDNKWYKSRRSTLDSNLGRQDGRRRRIHWAMVAPRTNYFGNHQSCNHQKDDVLTHFGIKLPSWFMKQLGCGNCPNWNAGTKLTCTFCKLHVSQNISPAYFFTL